MRQVQTTSHYGAHVHLDQCPHCGGLWFDGNELYEVKHGEAESLEAIDLEKLAELHDLKNTSMHCPADGNTLTKFSDPNFPSTIQIEVCPHCGGAWLNRGEFRRFQSDRQQHQGRRAKQRLDPRLEDQLDRMLAFSRESNFDTLGRLGKLLSTRISRSNFQPIPGYGTTEKDASTVQAVSRIANALLTSLLRRITGM